MSLVGYRFTFSCSVACDAIFTYKIKIKLLDTSMPYKNFKMIREYLYLKKKFEVY